MSQDKPKKKVKLKMEKKIVTPYGKYSGIAGQEGKPSELEAIKANVEYMKHNSPSSNIYRPENQHISINYSRKKKSDMS